MKEAITIAVITTKAKSRKNHNKNTQRTTKTARIIVPVDMDIEAVPFFSNIEI